jgi:hypothetical protein
MISHGQDRITMVRKYWKVDHGNKNEWSSLDLGRALDRAREEYVRDHGHIAGAAIKVTLEDGYLVVSYITEEKEN